MNDAGKCVGFSLVDVVIAMAVVAILASLAMPGFSEVLQRGRRVDAINSLLALQLAEERWRANHGSYASLDELSWSDISTEGHYRLRVEQISAAGFLASAEPLGDGAQHDDACGTYALDQRGPVLTNDYADAACWRR